MDPIRWVIDALVRVLPPSGRHRTDGGARAHADPHADVPAARPTRRLAGQVPRGEDIGHVRPYLVAHERQQEERRRRTRRRALLLAVQGIDLGPLMVHGVRVAG